MKWILPVTIAVLALFANGDVTAQGNPTPPCRARTLDLRAHRKGVNPQSLEDSVPTGCQLSFNRGLGYESNNLFQQSYDTLHDFVQRCATDDTILAAGAFGCISGELSFGGL